MDNFINKITWDENGLLPVVAQDATSGRVLMVAWMNGEALALTVQEQRAVYWSRSRKKLWCGDDDDDNPAAAAADQDSTPRGTDGPPLLCGWLTFRVYTKQGR